jgi:hypothetical protein
VVRESTAFVGAAAIASALVVLAYLVAPRSCQGGLELYVWCGGAALLTLPALPFAVRMGRSTLIRLACALGFFAFGAGVWLVGLIAANVRFIGGLGFL